MKRVDVGRGGTPIPTVTSVSPIVSKRGSKVVPLPPLRNEDGLPINLLQDRFEAIVVVKWKIFIKKEKTCIKQKYKPFISTKPCQGRGADKVN